VTTIGEMVRSEQRRRSEARRVLVVHAHSGFAEAVARMERSAIRERW